MVERSFNSFRTTSHRDAFRWFREEQEKKLRRCLAENGGWATRLAIRYITGAHYGTSERAVDFMDYMAMQFKTGECSTRTLGIAMRRIKPENGSWK